MSVSSSRTTVCNEVFDENSLPSEEEVHDYAVKIGINPEAEPHLLHLARDGLMQALPPDWKPCYAEDLDSWYYFNFRTGQSQWEHPLDDVYRALVRKGRSESLCSSAGDDDSKTSMKEDLKSYEEAVSSDMISRNSDPLKGTAALRKGSLQLTPLRKTAGAAGPLAARGALARAESLPAGDGAGVGAAAGAGGGGGGDGRRGDEWEASAAARIDIDKMDLGGSSAARLARRDRLAHAQEKHPRTMHSRSELTLSGGGSIFLKSNKARTPDTPETPLVSPGQPPPVIEVVTNSDPNDPVPKSILRGGEALPKSPQNRSLWDLDPREMSSEEKQLWKKQELEEEQRKSVRFNLDKELDIRFQISDSEENGEEEEVEEEEEIVKEEWNSEDEEPDDERLIAGVKVSDILNLMDASELDEPSAKDVGNLPVLPEDNFETQLQRDMISENVEQLENAPSVAPETWWEGCVVVHQTQTWQHSEDPVETSEIETETSTTSELSQSSDLTSYDIKLEEIESVPDSKDVIEDSSERVKETSSSDMVGNDSIPDLIITEAPDEKRESEEEDEEEEEEEEEEENKALQEPQVERKESETIAPTDEVPAAETIEMPVEEVQQDNEEKANEEEGVEGEEAGDEENDEEEVVAENKPVEPVVAPQEHPGVPSVDKEEEEEDDEEEEEEDENEEENEEEVLEPGVKVILQPKDEPAVHPVATEPEDELVVEEVIEIEDVCVASEGDIDLLEEGPDGDSGKLGISATSLSNLEGLRLNGAVLAEDLEGKEDLEDSEDLRFSISPAPVLRPPRLDALRQKGASSPEEESSTGGGLKRGDDSEQFTLSPTPILRPPRVEALRQKGASSPEDDSSAGGGPGLKRGGGGGGEDSEEDGGGGALQQARDRELLREAQRLVEERHHHMFRLQTESQRMLRAFQEQLQMNTDTAVHRLEEEHAHQLAQLQEQLLGEEEAERQRLQAEVAGRLACLQDQLRAQEQAIREGVEARLAEQRAATEAAAARQAEEGARRLEEARAALEAQGRDQAERLRREMLDAQADAAQRHRKELEEVEARAQAQLAERLEARLRELEAGALAQAEAQLEARREALLEEQSAALEEMRVQHRLQQEQLRSELKEEEEALRREHVLRLEEARVRLEAERQRAREKELQGEEKERDKLLESARILEKLRCEKRLLEDKYRSLKEKYIRLKTDVKLSIERRKRREGGGGGGGGTTTGSETERSTSHTRTSANSAAVAVAAARPPDSDRYCPANITHPMADLVYFCHYSAPLL